MAIIGAKEKPMQPSQVIDFWTEAGPAHWFARDESFDRAIIERFGAAHEAAAAGALAAWERTPEGALALLLLLDQFPRNMFRGQARAFATDAQALAIAERAIAAGFDSGFALPLRRFFYLPAMHAEDLGWQRRCEDLCAQAADEEGVRFAAVHREIIERFGRFPHRNPLLGRATTPDEQAFLDAGGFAG